MSTFVLTRPSEKYYFAIANIISPSVITNLIKTSKSKYLSEVLSGSQILNSIDTDITLRELFDGVYNFLSQKYRNEYVYKNVIANKIIEGAHSLDLSYMLTELDVGVCKADVVILNGTSTVYEIKSEYDSLDRINRQIGEYKKVFDKINVITCNSQARKVEKLLPNDVGLTLLTLTNDFSVIKQAESNKQNVLPSVIFDSLRKNEYTQIIKKYYGFIPDVPNTLIYSVCKNLFCNLEPSIAHDEMVLILSKRKEARRLRDFFVNLPPSLTAYAIGHTMTNIQAKQLVCLLEYKLKEIICD